MNSTSSQLIVLIGFIVSIMVDSVFGDHGYSAPAYSAPSYSAPSYSAPSYSAPSYKGHNAQVHQHHHYYHPAPQAQRPTYSSPSYQNNIPQYYQGFNNYGYAQRYGYPAGGYQEDEYIHLNKKELTRGALLLGAGVLKGIVLTGLINNANNGIVIG